MSIKRNTRVLIVDDNAHSRSILKAILASAGVEVRECESGPAALATLELWPCDLVITDYEMRPMNGLDLVRAIRQHRNPGLRARGVLMITAFGDQQLVLEARAAGVDGLVPKPFGTGIVLERVQSALERSAVRMAETSTGAAPKLAFYDLA